VGPQPIDDDLSDFVLGPFTAEEREILDGILDPMSEAVESWLENGIEVAMNRFNR
jgi:PTH1 family peptidyl-tRNA hydrolase